MNPIEQRYFSLGDTAKYLGLSPKTIYSWVEKGAIPAYKLGRVWRFDRDELERFVRGTAEIPGLGNLQTRGVSLGEISR
jgi:excisionase family DNA binding protein